MNPATWPGTNIPISRGNGFDWQDGKPSMFLADPTFNKNAKTGERATASVQALREQGRDNSTLYGISVKADELVAAFKMRIKKGGI